MTQERIAAQMAELDEGQLQAAQAIMARWLAADLTPSNMTNAGGLPSAAAAGENIYALKHALAQLSERPEAYGVDGNSMQAARFQQCTGATAADLRWKLRALRDRLSEYTKVPLPAAIGSHRRQCPAPAESE